MADRSIEYMRLDQIPRARRNPKNHSTKTIRDSIGRHGFVEAPTIDERTGRLVAGHGRLDQLDAAHAAGTNAPAGIQVDGDGHWLVPVQRGWASTNDAEAEAYLLTSNQATIAGGWNDTDLAPIIIGLQSGPGLAGVGFTTEDIDQLFARIADAPPPRNRRTRQPSARTVQPDNQVGRCLGVRTAPRCLRRLPHSRSARAGTQRRTGTRRVDRPALRRGIRRQNSRRAEN